MWTILFVILAIIVVILIWGAFANAAKEAEWHPSSKGNQTKIENDNRLTVFESDGGWKFSCAMNRPDSEAYFSDPFETQQEAMRASVDFANDRNTSERTKREKSREKHDQMAFEAAKNAQSFFEATNSEVAEMHSQNKFLLKDLRPLRKKIGRYRSRLIDATVVLKSEYLDDEADEALDIASDLKELENHTIDLIKWKEAKSDNPPPNMPEIS
ncbi:hypothetical protein [Martelella mediterranea]|uniref:Uncharacterized protein n=1 Tax=Martelella mediterranea TaxID=293089 RepID=A0A4R3NWP3_9HYPH|nr:hypothetical protein [Martelella mediterranea]TCT42783.1 hypothetical protein EDC90_100484 [Martelella mediterranea]